MPCISEHGQFREYYAHVYCTYSYIAVSFIMHMCSQIVCMITVYVCEHNRGNEEQITCMHLPRQEGRDRRCHAVESCTKIMSAAVVGRLVFSFFSSQTCD
jgi:hypothetical protein